MEETMKNRIKELRMQGRSYSEIASEVGVNVNTVKAYCNRNNIVLYKCPQCGTIVLQNPHRKRKRFCSTKCRMKWWNAHADEGNRHPHHTKECPVCHKVFPCFSSKQRTYCSRECYAIARKREKGNGYEQDYED